MSSSTPPPTRRTSASPPVRARPRPTAPPPPWRRARISRSRACPLRSALATQYNSLLTQIDQLAGDASFNGTNLIGGKGTNNNLTINFNAKGNSNLTVTATDETSNGLGLKAITGSSAAGTVGQGNFLLNKDINTTLNNLTTASTSSGPTPRPSARPSVVQNRQTSPRT